VPSAVQLLAYPGNVMYILLYRSSRMLVLFILEIPVKANSLEVLGGVADRLGLIKAELAALKAEEAKLKETLIESGLAVVEGSLYRVAVSETAGKTLIDWKSVAEKFSPSRQLVTANTSYGEAFFTVRVSARKS
jgi:hypothetical protein